jgi:hypothetical protein
VVDQQPSAATGARNVTGHSSGVNLPAGRSADQEDEI